MITILYCYLLYIVRVPGVSTERNKGSAIHNDLYCHLLYRVRVPGVSTDRNTGVFNHDYNLVLLPAVQCQSSRCKYS